MPMTRSRTRQESPLAGLPEEIQQEILVRLPAKSVLRCRAVCRCWRRLTSAPKFLLEHHSHQPQLPLVATTLGGDDDYSISLDVVDLRAAEIQRAPPGPYPGFGCTIEASCDGLVIVGKYIGNPATRQWAPLPRHVNNLVGLFRHQPSEEYRVLYWRPVPNAPVPLDLSEMVYCPIEYFVLAVGSDKPRVVKCSLTPVERNLIGGPGPSIFGAPVLLHSCLHVHWRKRGLGLFYHKILVFDTVAESFRQMRPPAVNPRHEMQLLDMGGTLAATSATYRMTELRIFMLQDHQQQQDVWAFQYRIKLPVMDIRRFQEEGDWWAKVVSKDGDVLVSCFGRLLHCDRNGKLVADFKYDDDLPVVIPHRLKESLIQHPFLQKTKEN